MAFFTGYIGFLIVIVESFCPIGSAHSYLHARLGLYSLILVMERTFKFSLDGKDVEFLLFGIENLETTPRYRVIAYRPDDLGQEVPYAFLTNDAETLNDLHFVRDYKEGRP